jgi:O-antigen ligase
MTQALDAFLTPLARLRGGTVATARGPGIGFGIATGLCISLFPFADLIFRPKLGWLQHAVNEAREASPQLAAALVTIILLVSVPILLGALKYGVEFRRAKLFVPAILPLCLAIPLSYFERGQMSDLLYCGLIYFVFGYCAVMISANLDFDAFLRGMLGAVAGVLTLAMVAVVVDGDFSWGRLMGRTAPNYWGAVAATSIYCTLAMRGWFLRLAVISLSLAIMLMAQSRGVMASLTVSMVLLILIYMRSGRVSTWVWVFGGLVVLIAGVFGLDYLLSHVFLVDDNLRGIGSGFTGRAAAWQETWDLFVQSPLFGVGYRRHEQYLLSASSAHQAYLATLAEMGIFGLVAYLFFLWGGAGRALWLAWEDPTGPRLTVAGMLTQYATQGLTERAALNTGSTFSLLTILLVAWAWRQEVDPPHERRS